MRATHEIDTGPSTRAVDLSTHSDIQGQAQAKPITALQRVLGVLVVCVGAQPFTDLLWADPRGGMMIQGLNTLLYLVAIGLLTLRFKMTWLLWFVRSAPVLLVLLVVALASTFWSIDPALSLRRSISLIGSTCVGVYIGYYFDAPHVIKTIFWAALVLVLASIVTATLVPEYGTMAFFGPWTIAGTWKGILSSKNELGRIASILSTICFVMIVAPNEGFRMRYRRLAFTMLPVSLFTLVKAQSVGATIVLISSTALCIFLVVAARYRFSTKSAAAMILYGLTLLTILSVVNLAYLTHSVGRDPTLTGRAFIWRDTVAMIQARPAAGFGFEVVYGSDRPEVKAYKSAISAPHSHNGYLYVAVHLGIPAAALAVYLVLSAATRALRTYLRAQTIPNLFAAVFLVVFVIQNLVESTILVNQDIGWMLFVGLYVMLLQASRARTMVPMRGDIWRGPAERTVARPHTFRGHPKLRE